MNSTTVLIVDDDLMTLRAMRRVLQSNSYCIVTASSGEAALELIRSPLNQHIKLLLLDLSLMDMSGFSVAERAQEYIPDVKILFVSGYDAADNAHADRWICKPFNVDLLKARILKELDQ